MKQIYNINFRNNRFKSILIAMFLVVAPLFLSAQTQNETMYIMKSGLIVGRHNVNTQVDSIVFYNPTADKVLTVETVDILGGTFTMGSPIDEVGRDTTERQTQVNLSSFKIGKYEVTNAQFALFLNNVGNVKNGIFTTGEFVNQKVFAATTDIYFFNGLWFYIKGLENHPVTGVSWYGAMAFANYVGGTLPTEAQWEYACRAGTVTPFNTGSCLTNMQANFGWSSLVNTCNITVVAYLGKSQAVGTYAANAWGLYDMHGNALEWCSDWYGPYPTTAQNNPTGAAPGTLRVLRGGGWSGDVLTNRSAMRLKSTPNYSSITIGFRVAFVQ